VSSELYNTCSANDEFQCLGATVIATTQIRNCSEGVNVLQLLLGLTGEIHAGMTKLYQMLTIFAAGSTLKCLLRTHNSTVFKCVVPGTCVFGERLFRMCWLTNARIYCRE